MTLASNLATRVWLGLLLATAVQALLFEADKGTDWVTTSIVVIGGLKVAAIVAFYVEATCAPRPLQVACVAWVIAIVGTILVEFHAL